MENDRISLWKFAEEKPDDDEVRANKLGGQVGGGASDPKAISTEGHRRQISSFCRALLGKPDEIIDGREAAVAVEVIEAIYKSAKSGRSEKV
jgi:predicted dehydrogenase